MRFYVLFWATSSKGGSISERFSLWHKSQNKVPNHYPEHYPPKEKMVRIVIWYLFFGHFSQSENLSEMKPPLKFEPKRKWCLFMVISYCTCEHGRVTKFEVSYSFTDLNGFTFSPSILWKKIYLWNTGWSNLNQTIGHPKKFYERVAHFGLTYRL